MPNTYTAPDNRRFRLVAREPYTTKDGRNIDLLVWEGGCVDCGAKFLVKTPDAAPENTKAFLRKRCDAHKTSRKACLAKMIEGSKARRKVTDAQVCEIRAYAAQGLKSADLELVYPLARSTLDAIIRGTRR